jgi:hypothetical protein
MSAQRTVQMQTAKPTFAPIAHGVLQRCTATAECDDCRKKHEGTLQRAAVNNSTVNEVPPIVHEMLSSPGQPLDAVTRALMEPRFGHDFSGVRVHTDAKAPESTQGRGHDFAAVGVEQKDGVVHGPAGTTNHWDACPASWRPKANAAQALGASWVDNVVNGLSSILAIPPPIPKPVETLLLRHFHTSVNKDIATINGRYKKIQMAIHSSLNFECETSCDANVLAYVYSIWTDLHLCPYWFNSASDLQAATVIHEIAHDVVGADDNAYEWQTAKYASMSVSDAMNNADSFGHFAWEASKPAPAPPPPGPTPKGP